MRLYPPPTILSFSINTKSSQHFINTSRKHFIKQTLYRLVFILDLFDPINFIMQHTIYYFKGIKIRPQVLLWALSLVADKNATPSLDYLD